MVDTKDQKQCYSVVSMVSCLYDSVNIDIIEWFVNTVDMKIKACNAVNAMFVDTVDTGVCGFYTTLYTE